MGTKTQKQRKCCYHNLNAKQLRCFCLVKKWDAPGDDYVDRIFAKFPDVKGKVDICSYWFRLAHNHLREDFRAGLVATNTISQGQTRQATLD